MRRYYIVLCEDLQAWVFVRRALLAVGAAPRDIRCQPYPDNLFFIQGPPVDEHTEYPKLTGHEADAEPAAVAFATHAKAGTSPPAAPPSLVTGLDELRRVV
jgi:hypothetical protein